MTKQRKTWVAVALWAVALGLVEVQITRLGRISETHSTRSLDLSEDFGRLRSQVQAEQDRLREETVAQQQRIEQARAAAAEAEHRLSALAAGLESEQRTLAQQTRLDVRQALGRLERTVDTRVERIKFDLDGRIASFDDQRERIAALEAERTPDPDELARKLLYPSIQIKADGGVGAGVIVYSRPAAQGKYDTYVLSAYHVISGTIQKSASEETRKPVEVRIFDPQAADYRTHAADVVSYDPELDVSLIKLRSEAVFPHVARFASSERLKDTRKFMPIYTVGCPLGHDPMPSRGQITLQTKTMKGKLFWIVSAPTIFGNSGGGVFLESSGELIGLCSMVCVYENFISLPVTHMGIMVPAEAIFAWLDSQYLQFVYHPEVTKDTCDAMRKAMRDKRREILEVTWEY